MYDETIKYRGFTIEVIQDDSAESPDRLGDDSLFLIADHRDFFVEHEGYTMDFVRSVFEGGKDYDGNVSDEALELLKQFFVFELDAYIHSGVALRLEELANLKKPKESSIFGAVLVDKKEFKTLTEARRVAAGLVKEFNSYLSGEVYGYRIPEIENEAAWGYYGSPEESGIIEEAKAIIDNHIKSDPKFINKKINGIMVHIGKAV